jgi:hypothetical protein
MQARRRRTLRVVFTPRSRSPGTRAARRFDGELTDAVLADAVERAMDAAGFATDHATREGYSLDAERIARRPLETAQLILGFTAR